MTPDRPPNTRPTRVKRPWSTARAATMLERGLTYEEIGARFGLAKSTVFEKMQGLRALLAPAHVEAFKQREPAILTATRMRVLDALNSALDDPRVRRKTTINQYAYAHGSLHGSERLERNQSTSNLALHELVESVERDSARRRATMGSTPPPLPVTDASQVPEIVGRDA